MRFFHEQVKTDCVYCHGGGCVHCASRHLTQITGEVAVGVLSVEQLERLIDCLNARSQLVLQLSIVVPGPERASAIWARFCEGKRPEFLGDLEGGMYAQPGEVPIPASDGSWGRVKALLAQMDKMDRLDPEPQALRNARQMLRKWEQHSTQYAIEQAQWWRAEVWRIEEALRAEAKAKEGPAPALPERIVLQRKRGWRMPENTVKVDRSTRWGNPFQTGSRVTGIRGLCRSAGEDYVLKTAAEAVHCYQCWLAGEVTLYNQRPPTRWLIQRDLRGKNLACWCKAGECCHAEVLLEIANGEEADDAA